MATPAAIASLKFLLPEGYADYGVTDDIIAAQLDAIGQTKTVLFVLRGIAARIASIEDVTESGSSRTLQFHDRLMAMITDWQSRADAEDTATGALPPKMHANIRTAKRPDLLWPTVS